MNFVNEYDGARAILPGPLGIRHHLLDFLDARQHCGKLDEIRLRHARDDLGQSRLAGPRRPPENQRARIVALDLCAQRLARTHQVFLPDVFLQCARTHPIRQRTTAVRWIHSARNGLKQAHLLLITQPVITTESQSHRESLARTTIDHKFFSVPLCLCGEKFLMLAAGRFHTAQC